jgi:hypothetical protein
MLSYIQHINLLTALKVGYDNVREGKSGLTRITFAYSTTTSIYRKEFLISLSECRTSTGSDFPIAILRAFSLTLKNGLYIFSWPMVDGTVTDLSWHQAHFEISASLFGSTVRANLMLVLVYSWPQYIQVSSGSFDIIWKRIRYMSRASPSRKRPTPATNRVLR